MPTFIKNKNRRCGGLTENAGHEIAGQNIDDSVDTKSAETRVAERHKCDAVSLPEQTHLTAVLLSTAAAGVAADVEVVPVAAAGDAVAGRLRHLRRWWTRCGVTLIRLFLVCSSR